MGRPLHRDRGTAPPTSSGDVLRLFRRRDRPGRPRSPPGRDRPGLRARPAFWPPAGRTGPRGPTCRQVHRRSPEEAQHRDTASASRGRAPPSRRNGKRACRTPLEGLLACLTGRQGLFRPSERAEQPSLATSITRRAGAQRRMAQPLTWPTERRLFVAVWMVLVEALVTPGEEKHSGKSTAWCPFL